MASWPEYARVVAHGYRVAQDPDVGRTPWDDGLVRQERRFTAALTVRRVTAHLADDEKLTDFRTWADTNAHQWFSWTDPEDGTTREVRVRGGAGGIEYRARTAGGRRTWELTCELEGDLSRVISGA